MLFFPRIYKIKTRLYKNNLRPNSLDQNVGYMYRTFQKLIYYNKSDIDVQKIKVKTAFF